MSMPLRVLMLEDTPSDAELVLLELQRTGYNPDWHRVWTESDFLAALQRPWDIILSDFCMPQFDAPRALKLLRERLPDMPFIVISGTIGEDVAVDVMRLGATDYLLKDRLTRLGTAVDSALYQKRLKESVRNTEHALRISEERFRLALNNSPICVFNQDRELRYTWMYNSIAGKSIDEVAGRTDEEIFEQPAARQLTSVKRRVLNSGRSVSELIEIRQNGRLSYHNVSVEAQRDARGQVVGIVGAAIDITKLKEAESERELLATAIEQAQESVVITDINGHVKYANPGFERMTGYGPDDYTGQEINALINTSTVGRAPSLWRGASDGGVWRGRVELSRKDRTTFTSDLAVSPVVDAAGQLTSFVLVGRDVTREVLVEAQLIQSQKMEAIGTLAGGIAHDFNNVLSAMIGYTEFVVQRYPEETSIQEDLGTVLQAGDRARKLVQQILTVSREHDEERSPVQLTFTVDEAKGFLRASLPATITLSVEAEADLPMVLADATQMSQVVMNLCTNAAHAMRDKPGSLTVRLGAEELGDARPARLSGLAAGRYVRLSVEDTGHGMDAKTMERIFEPFFTTKGVGEGTGLGLSTVYSIIKQHGGLICVESTPGQGTCFDVYLPCYAGSRAADKPVHEGSHRGSGRIMVVDDEPALGKLLSRILTSMGYTVTVELNGENALAALRANPDGIDLVMTDHTMPGITGMELARAIGDINSEILVILTGGNLRGIDKPDGSNIDGLLFKPYNTDDVGRIVRKTLENAGRKVAGP